MHIFDGEGKSGPRLLIALSINLLIPAAQVAGGLLSHSMALFSDAVHNFSDFTALLIAYVAYLMGKKGASAQNTFGYKRAEILGAVNNVALLIAASTFILYKAFERFLRPEPVIGRIVMVLAAVGILGNGLSAWLVHRDPKHSLSVRVLGAVVLRELLERQMDVKSCRPYQLQQPSCPCSCPSIR